MSDRDEGVGRAVTSLGDDLRPVGVVSHTELREQPDQRAPSGGLDGGTERAGGQFVAATLEDASSGRDVGKQRT